MRKFSNFYVFGFASIMVIIVAAILSLIATFLQPMQEKNREIEKKKNILSSIKIESDRTDAEAKYEEYISKSFVVDHTGEIMGGEDAFVIEMEEEMRKPLEERHLPVFIGTAGDGEKYIVPLFGKGLWGPIWGYLAFDENLNKIFGANFDHEEETPGLGAEINQPPFQDQFIGKSIFDEGLQFTSIMVTKAGTSAGNPHAVDAISGGTITSKGLEKMLYDCLISYESYFKNAVRDE
jgi:Na+-transporting NADH:ubiquinone oxidoreductase subunit C